MYFRSAFLRHLSRCGISKTVYIFWELMVINGLSTIAPSIFIAVLFFESRSETMTHPHACILHCLDALFKNVCKVIPRHVFVCVPKKSGCFQLPKMLLIMHTHGLFCWHIIPLSITKINKTENRVCIWIVVEAPFASYPNKDYQHFFSCLICNRCCS